MCSFILKCVELMSEEVNRNYNNYNRHHLHTGRCTLIGLNICEASPIECGHFIWIIIKLRFVVVIIIVFNFCYNTHTRTHSNNHGKLHILAESAARRTIITSMTMMVMIKCPTTCRYSYLLFQNFYIWAARHYSHFMLKTTIRSIFKCGDYGGSGDDNSSRTRIVCYFRLAKLFHLHA